MRNPYAHSPFLHIGIDQSLNGSGIAAVYRGEVVAFDAFTTTQTKARNMPNLHFFESNDSSMASRIERVEFVSKWLLSWVLRLKCEFGVPAYVGMEGYAMNMRSNRFSDLCELGGAIKMGLFQNQIPYQVYTPSALKKAFTGKGNAKKPQMIAACESLTNVDLSLYGKSAEDLADAILIAKMCEYHVVARMLPHFDVQIPASVKKELYLQQKKNVPIYQRGFIIRDIKPRYRNFD